MPCLMIRKWLHGRCCGRWEGAFCIITVRVLLEEVFISAEEVRQVTHLLLRIWLVSSRQNHHCLTQKLNLQSKR